MKFLNSVCTAVNNVFYAVGSGFSEYSGTNANKIVEGVKKLFGTLGTWGGAMMAVVGVFSLILAVRNEDNEGRNKAVYTLIGAIALLSAGGIINIFFS